MALGQNIKKYRKEKKMTQKELATLVGVNEVTIRSYEAEKYRPKIGTLQKIAEALDVSLVALDPVLYENTFDKKVGQNIANMRNKKNLSQDDLGKMLNLSIEEIKQLEAGRFSLKIKDIENIAQKLSIHTESLLLGVDIDHNILENDRSDLGRKLSKQMSIIKFLDALYYRADITKVKIYSRDTKEEVYNSQYISYYDGSRSDDLCIEYTDLERLVDIFENICNNIIPALSEPEDDFLYENFQNKDHFYRLYTETIKFQTSTKIKYEPYSDREIEELKKEIERKANKEEFTILEPEEDEPTSN